MPDWKPHAERLAAEVTHPNSRWYNPVATTPRHIFVPRWWGDGADENSLGDGASDPDRWMRVAYSNTSLVTRIGPRHADYAQPGETADGRPTSSSTLPWLVVRMYQHAMLADDSHVLVVTGSGYGTALLCERLGEEHVTSIDIDPYLVKAAGERLESIGLRPRLAVCDITGTLPGDFDRIISTVSVEGGIPASWLAALRPGGRLVTTVAHTGLVVTADKTEDGGAVGQIEYDGAGFMATRHSDDYPPSLDDLYEHAKRTDGSSITTSRYPILYAPNAWDVWSMLELAVPGIEYRRFDDGDRRIVWMLHPDGSWARATAPGFLDSPEVHQSGPRKLWDELDHIRDRLNREGGLPVYGAKVTITPDGETTLTRGGWSASLTT
jgi:protein-L-isoaspartate O-methyltransferase